MPSPTEHSKQLGTRTPHNSVHLPSYRHVTGETLNAAEGLISTTLSGASAPVTLCYSLTLLHLRVTR